MNLDESQINIVSNFLANYHDWPIQNIANEFDTYLNDNEIPLTVEDSRFLLKSFLEIDSTERFNSKFDHFKFVKRVTSIIKDPSIF